MICPKCGKRMLRGTGKGSYHCLSCGFDFINDENVYTNDKPVELDPNNPYTNFAEEMSLLREALRDSDFKGDMLTDILTKMTPIIWDKVEKRRIHENLVKAVDELEKQDYKPPAWIEKLNEKNQKREDEAWKEARKRVLCE